MEFFTLEELYYSKIAEARGLNNKPPTSERAIVEANLKALVEHILDPARRLLGNPIKVNSGYRSKEVNRAVGGSKTSQHMKGEAADITRGDNKRLFEIIKKLGGFDQLIWEQGGRWIHVSYKRAGGNREQVLYK